MTKDLIKVDSSVIDSIKYSNKELTLIFNNKKVYRYFNVPKQVVKQLLSSDSIGNYFVKNIKYNFPTIKEGLLVS